MHRCARQIGLLCLALAGGGAVAFPAHAGTATTSLRQQLDVVQGCRVTVGPMQFGMVSIITPTVDTTSDIRLRCTPNTPFSVSLDNGDNFSAGSRRMRSQLFPTIYKAYSVFTNPARTTNWTAATRINGNSGGSGAATVRAYGRVTGMTVVLWGAYVDNVTVTVEF